MSGIEIYKINTAAFTANTGVDQGLFLPQSTLSLTGAVTTPPASSATKVYARTVGQKVYELKDHLGNVRVLVSDQKRAELISGSIVERALVTGYNNYYPFGLKQSPASYAAAAGSQYRYGFNGKEQDSDFQNNYDYGFRIYNPSIAKFLSVDPLTKSYPMLTPYQFASNRPIDGIDLDGLEFSKATLFDKNTGTTYITIKVKVRVSVSPEITDPKFVESLKQEAKVQFREVIESVYDPVRKIQYSGELEYSDNATIGFSIDPPVVKENKDDIAILGASFPGYFGANIGVQVGQTTTLFTPKEFGLTVVHEILHQGGVKHPTEEGASEDVKLERLSLPRVPNSFRTNFNTTKEIYNNVMLYHFYNVNGENVGDVRGSEENANKATPGQINKVNENIDKGKVNGEPMNDF